MVPKPTYKRMLIGLPGQIYMSDVECILYTYTVYSRNRNYKCPVPGNSAGALMWMVSSRDPFKGES